MLLRIAPLRKVFSFATVGFLTFATLGQDGQSVQAQGITPPSPTPAAAPTIVTDSTEQQPPTNSVAPQTTANTQPTPAANPSTRNQTRRRNTSFATASSSNRSRNNSAYSPRLARAPFLLGDSFAPSVVFSDELGLEPYEAALGGGATRSKIAENSSSLPMDRLIFNYNHFHNAIDDTDTVSTNVDRFTLGYEKTFHDQMTSIEIRMPFVLDNDYIDPNYARNGSDAGNLALTFKAVLTSTDDSLLAAGLTVDTPTGGNTVLSLRTIADPLTVDISNDAVHLAPFLGFLYAPQSGNTHQGFLQIDIPTNANSMTFTDSGGTNTTELIEQTLLYVDYSFSKELYNAGRSARGHEIRRVLGLAEIHYTTTLEDSDAVLSGTTNNPLFQVTSAGNRIDVVNLTLGLHTELSSGTQLRLGTVSPITDDDDRFFDFEFQFQVNVPL